MLFKVLGLSVDISLGPIQEKQVYLLGFIQSDVSQQQLKERLLKNDIYLFMSVMTCCISLKWLVHHYQDEVYYSHKLLFKYLHRVFYVPQIFIVHSFNRFGVPTSFISESSLLSYTLNVMEVIIQEVSATDSYGSMRLTVYCQELQKGRKPAYPSPWLSQRTVWFPVGSHYYMGFYHKATCDVAQIIQNQFFEFTVGL